MAATGWDIRSLLGAGFYFFAFLIWIAILIFPLSAILRRTGHNSAWSLVMFLPVINVIAVWIFAFKRWPLNGNSSSNGVSSPTSGKTPN